MNDTPDGITLLRDDHRAVVELFQRIEDIPSGAPADSEEMKVRRALFEQVSEELSRHAMAEEELLYPLVRSKVAHGNELADHALEEHQQVKETLARLERMSLDNLEFEGEFRTLMATIRDHVNDEEAELFPMLQRELDQEALDALGVQLAAAKALAPTRPHPNAPNRPPFNVLAGAGAALVDRARDAITGHGDPTRK
jgi:iron-sulfur cluster repair protein YtfE (RIC family)